MSTSTEPVEANDPNFKKPQGGIWFVWCASLVALIPTSLALLWFVGVGLLVLLFLTFDTRPRAGDAGTAGIIVIIYGIAAAILTPIVALLSWAFVWANRRLRPKRPRPSEPEPA